jgi:tartrate-resistant acid phosphatase type 5
LPSYLYTLNVNTNDGETKLIKFIMIDTVVLCGNATNHEAPTFSSIKAKKKAAEYFEFVKLKIKKASQSEYKYIMVVGHFPVWSIAEHGPTRCLVEKLRPLIHAYQVSVYFCGHEHDMEHIREKNMFINERNVDYVVSGAGGSPFHSMANSESIPNETLKFYWASDFQLNGAYAYVDANLENVTISFLASSNKLLYKTILKRFE